MLKYLFTVVYEDSTKFKQPPEDISAIDPKRSAFFDIRQDDVMLFSLDDTEHLFEVDLRDGEFSVDGVYFFAQIPPSGAKLRLIYFRRHRYHFTAGLEEIGHEIEYHFGWQCTHEGKNYQQTLILT